MSVMGHTHTPLQAKMRAAVILTGLILVAEVVGGLVANSLALLSDAGHVFTDLLALLLSWFGVMQAERPASARMTFGYHRVGILIALVNAASIVIIAGVIFYEAYHRLLAPEEVSSGLMFGVALVGLLANLVVLWWLLGEQRQNLNVRSAFLHAGGDALASVGVIAGGLLILFTGRFIIDPIVSVAIGLIIAVGAFYIIRQAVEIILEASPGHVNQEDMVQAMLEVPGVRNVHDLHIWTIAPQMHALSCHILLEDEYNAQRAQVVERLNQVVGERFDIEHGTFQLECVGCDADALYCTFAPNANSLHQHQHH